MNRLPFARIFAAFALLASGASAAGQPAGQRPRNSDADFPPGFHHLRIGEAAPGFDLPGIDGRRHTLADFKEFPVLMVVFLSNHCPVSHAVETRLLPFVAAMRPRGLGVVAINPNHPDAVSITELGYSKYNDSFEEMKLYAEETGFTFPYLYDGETQATARAYGCLATPHVFLFDRDRCLRYAGRYDDSRFPGPDKVASPDARHAVVALLAGRPAPVELTRVIGCSTKWIFKTHQVAAADEEWKHEPVTLEPIDQAGVAALVANRSEKLRLFNVWATWCAPCVEEFPGLVALTRQFGSRDFEVITLSLDDPAHRDRAQKFLEARHAGIPDRLERSLQREGRATNNYLYTGASQDGLVAALDPSWPGPLPHTILVAPGGRILWRHNGTVDFPALQKRIYEELGGYYQ